MKTTMSDLENNWSLQFRIAPVAFVYSDSNCSGPYQVSGISIGGVILSGRSPLKKDAEVQVLLLAPGHPQMTIEGWVIHQERRGADEFVSAVAFCQVVSGVHQAGNKILGDAIELQEKPQETLVLVVDDSLGICRALKRDLTSLGCRAVYAVTILDAIMLLLDPLVRIEAAVVDLFMGPDDGLEILEFLSKWCPDIRRVLISGQVRIEQLNLARDSGRVQAVLQKPWSRDDLAGALELSGRGSDSTNLV